MKIAFITGGLEPGRDGVGDYTRRLAGELIRQGHPAIAVGLCDHYVFEPSLELQETDDNAISVLRFPLKSPWAQRVKTVMRHLSEFNPDWVSLQYVCYSYHPKGLGWGWNSLFTALGKMNLHRHLALHELWIGPPPFWRWLIGMGQRWVIRDLRRGFRPHLVTTSTPAYQRRLSSVGVNARVLPLFGNIPVAERDDNGFTGLLHSAGSSTCRLPRSSFLTGVVFGTIHPDFDAEPLVRWLIDLRELSGKPVLLTFVGRVGPASGKLTQVLRGSATNAVEVVILDEQPESIVSQALQFADFGINTGSAELLAKSGTFAAMREHGLPVVLADGDLDPLFQDAAPPILQFSDKDALSSLMTWSRRPCGMPGAAHTLSNLIQLFDAAIDERQSPKAPQVVRKATS